MRLLNNIFSVTYSFVRLRLISLYRSVSVKKIERLSPNVEVYVGKSAKLILGNRVRIHRNSRLVTDMEGKLEIGNDTAINQNCGIYCFESITIGNRCVIGPNVLIYDHDHDFRKGDVFLDNYVTSKVSIGNNVWIGANVVVLRGTTIGNNCVIAAGTVVRGKVDDDTILVQKRENTYQII